MKAPVCKRLLSRPARQAEKMSALQSARPGAERGPAPDRRRMHPARRLAKRGENPQSCPDQAQISDLLHRRIPFGGPDERLETLGRANARGWKIRGTGRWKAAPRASPTGRTAALQRG